MSINDNEEKENKNKAVTVLREKQKNQKEKGSKSEINELVSGIINGLTSRVNGEINRRGGCV